MWEISRDHGKTWKSPNVGMRKTNCVVAVRREQQYFVTICRNSGGRIIEAWDGKKKG